MFLKKIESRTSAKVTKIGELKLANNIGVTGVFDYILCDHFACS